MRYPYVSAYSRGLMINTFFKFMAMLRLRRFARWFLHSQNNFYCRQMTSSHIDTMFGPQAVVYNPQKKTQAITIGRNTLIDGELLIFDDQGKIEIGESTYIGKGSRVWSGDQVKIGDHVFVAHNVTITDTNAHQLSAKERADDYQIRIVEGHPYSRGTTLVAPITIENHVWINFGVSILKGVRIGEGAIIGAGSVVTKDIEPWTFVAGVPAKAIRQITER